MAIQLIRNTYGIETKVTCIKTSRFTLYEITDQWSCFELYNVVKNVWADSGISLHNTLIAHPLSLSLCVFLKLHA